MEIRTYPASQGLRWIREGWRLFRRQPVALTALSAFYLLLVLFPATVPLIGFALAGVTAPFAAFGMMEACRDTDRGQTPTPLAFGAALRSDPPRREMLRLGLIQGTVLLLVAIALAASGLDGAVQITQGDNADSPVFQIDRPLLLLNFVIFLPLDMAMWFAPVLVGWHRIPAPKALFFSFVACWRNRWPLLTYVVAIFTLCGATGSLAVAALNAVITSQDLLSLLSAPLLLLAAAFALATLYPVYRSIVVIPAEAVTQPQGTSL